MTKVWKITECFILLTTNELAATYIKFKEQPDRTKNQGLRTKHHHKMNCTQTQ